MSKRPYEKTFHHLCEQLLSAETRYEVASSTLELGREMLAQGKRIRAGSIEEAEAELPEAKIEFEAAKKALREALG